MSLPVITSITPSQGVNSDGLVVIDGEYFTDVTAVDLVLDGNKTNVPDFTVEVGNVIKFTPPSGLTADTTYSVVVTTTAGESNGIGWISADD
jgi:hypothetical protein